MIPYDIIAERLLKNSKINLTKDEILKSLIIDDDKIVQGNWICVSPLKEFKILEDENAIEFQEPLKKLKSIENGKLIWQKVENSYPDIFYQENKGFEYISNPVLIRNDKNKKLAIGRFGYNSKDGIKNINIIFEHNLKDFDSYFYDLSWCPIPF